jgi:hypothetical protein
MPCMGRPARPPSPVSQPAFKFKRFGVQFQVQSFCCSFFFSVADFFSRTKSFIDIDFINSKYLFSFKNSKIHEVQYFLLQVISYHDNSNVFQLCVSLTYPFILSESRLNLNFLSEEILLPSNAKTFNCFKLTLKVFFFFFKLHFYILCFQRKNLFEFLIVK